MVENDFDVETRTAQQRIGNSQKLQLTCFVVCQVLSGKTVVSAQSKPVDVEDARFADLRLQSTYQSKHKDPRV